MHTNNYTQHDETSIFNQDNRIFGPNASQFDANSTTFKDSTVNRKNTDFEYI